MPSVSFKVFLWIIFFLFPTQDFSIYPYLFGHETKPKEYLHVTPLLPQLYLCFLWSGFPHILADFKSTRRFLLHTIYLITPEETGKLCLPSSI